MKGRLGGFSVSVITLSQNDMEQHDDHNMFCWLFDDTMQPIPGLSRFCCWSCSDSTTCNIIYIFPELFNNGRCKNRITVFKAGKAIAIINNSKMSACGSLSS